MKRMLYLALTLCLLLGASACGTQEQTAPTPEQASPAQAQVSPAPEQVSPTPVQTPPAQAQAPLALARTYQETITEISHNGTIGVNLSQTELEQIVSALAAGGVTVSGVDGLTAMQNAQAIDAFFADRDAGRDSRLTIYELCLDGGLICHDLTFASGETTLSLTRIAWSGTEPTVGYSREYAVTELTYSGGTLHYVYDMPDNPPGTWHDGHIDTQKTFQIG